MRRTGAIPAVFLALALSSAPGQEAENKDVVEKPPVKRFTLIVEFIEIGRKDWNAWITDPDRSLAGPVLRNYVQQLIRGKKATVIHTAIGSSSAKAKLRTSSAGEYIYPTEYDFAEVSRDGKTRTHRQPNAFETRDTGIAFDARIDDSGARFPDAFDPARWTGIYRIKLSAELVEKIGDLPLGKNDGEKMAPLFRSLENHSPVRCIEGEPVLLGTHRPHKPAVETRKNPVILTFVRLDVHDLTDVPKEAEP